MDLLQTGLDEIVAIVGPNSSDAWNTVGADSERLLKVWVAKEQDDPAALSVAQQLTDILWELAAEEKSSSVPPSPPHLVIKESPAAPTNTPAPPRQPDTIAHIQPFSLSSVSAPTVVVVADPPSPIVVAEEKTVVVDLEAVEVDESDSEAPDQLAEEDEAEAVAEAEASVVEGEGDDEEEDAATAEEEEADEEDEVVEPAAEEEEEEGMSVEQITIRGRTYWRDTDTDELYAVVGEDDVGDKVGQIVNGVARFLPLKK